MSDTDIIPAGMSVVRHDGLGSTELSGIGDLSAAASAAAMAKQIEVHAIQADRRPRNIEMFRHNLLLYCKHPDFADAALYSRKVGREKNDKQQWVDKYAVDFSIRFCEAAMALYQHMYADTWLVHDDEKKLVVRISVQDVQNNTGWSQDIEVLKLVERSDARDRTVISQRLNSDGKPVYLVEATKDEVRSAMNSERSKLARDFIKRLLPFHILVEARRIIDAVRADDNAKDPEAAKKKVLDRFASIGVTAEDLQTYLGRSLSVFTEKDIAELGVLFNGIQEGEFKWADVLRMKNEPADGAGDAQPDPRTTRLREQIANARTKAPKKQSEAGGTEGQQP